MSFKLTKKTSNLKIFLFTIDNFYLNQEFYFYFQSNNQYLKHTVKWYIYSSMNLNVNINFYITINIIKIKPTTSK